MADVASVTDEPEVQSEEEKLKYLGLVEDAIQYIVDYASKTYDYVKENSGSLKPGVETIEVTIKTVAGPAIDKFNGVPVEVIKFVARKVEDSITQLDSMLPPVVKETAKSLSMVSDVKNVGVVETAKELLVKIEPVAEEYVSSAWQTLNDIPLVTKVVTVITPVASFVTEKYNETVQEKASFLPLVPTEKIAKVFTLPSKEEAEPAGPTEGEEVAEVPSGGGEEVVEEQ